MQVYFKGWIGKQFLGKKIAQHRPNPPTFVMSEDTDIDQDHAGFPSVIKNPFFANSPSLNNSKEPRSWPERHWRSVLIVNCLALLDQTPALDGRLFSFPLGCGPSPLVAVPIIMIGEDGDSCLERGLDTVFSKRPGDAGR